MRMMLIIMMRMMMVSIDMEDANDKNENDDNNEILFGQGFGCITDIKFKDDKMYVVSLTDGIIYRISPI